jgi:glycosyltransferase involved in cell wall biosynthesis
MQYKTPIISTNYFIGPAEILQDRKYRYLVNVDDSIALAKQIEKVILNYPDALKKRKKPIKV